MAATDVGTYGSVPQLRLSPNWASVTASDFALCSSIQLCDSFLGFKGLSLKWAGAAGAVSLFVRVRGSVIPCDIRVCPLKVAQQGLTFPCGHRGIARAVAKT